MILITGGAFQGKAECAGEIWKKMHEGDAPGCMRDGRDGILPEEEGLSVWTHVTDYMRIRMEAGLSAAEAEAEIRSVAERNPDIILITRELGCGLVPIDAFDRKYREAHGRMCCRLAERAERVYRVSCGLAQCIKGEKTC